MKKIIKYWNSLSQLTQNLCFFTFINIILINFLLIIVFSTPTTDTVLYDTKAFLQVRQEFADSWIPMKVAFSHIWNNDQQKPLYDYIFFELKTKFQYPLTSLLIVYPFKVIDNFLKVFGTSGGYRALKGFSWLLVVVTIYFVIRIFNFSLTMNVDKTTNRSSKIDLFTRNTLIVSLALTFYPLVKAFSLGQIQVWLNALFTILFWCWMNEKKVISGLIAGTMCLIKPQYSIIILWGIWRKEWTFTITLVTTALIGILVSILIFGLENNVNYISVLSFISKHGEAYYPNQSINGLLNRLLFNGNNLKFEENSFPPFNYYVYAATISSSIVFISMALFPQKKLNKKGSIIDIAIIVLSCTIASPIAWEHHYGILLPIYAFLLPCLLKRKIFGKTTIIVVIISYLLTSNYFGITNKLAYARFNFNIFQSYLFIGSLILLLCLYLLREDFKNSRFSQD